MKFWPNSRPQAPFMTPKPHARRIVGKDGRPLGMRVAAILAISHNARFLPLLRVTVGNRFEILAEPAEQDGIHHNIIIIIIIHSFLSRFCVTPICVVFAPKRHVKNQNQSNTGNRRVRVVDADPRDGTKISKTEVKISRRIIPLSAS
jgi:hypothetical protein